MYINTQNNNIYNSESQIRDLYPNISFNKGKISDSTFQSLNIPIRNVLENTPSNLEPWESFTFEDIVYDENDDTYKKTYTIFSQSLTDLKSKKKSESQSYRQQKEESGTVTTNNVTFKTNQKTRVNIMGAIQMLQNAPENTTILWAAENGAFNVSLTDLQNAFALGVTYIQQQYDTEKLVNDDIDALQTKSEVWNFNVNAEYEAKLI